MFAVVTISGKQYKVSPGDVIEVDRIEGVEGDKVTFDKVLLVNPDKGEITVGQPDVAGAKVIAKIIKQGKGEKIEIRRYKSKVRYRKQRGFRAQITTLSVEKIVHA